MGSKNSWCHTNSDAGPRTQKDEERLKIQQCVFLQETL